MALLELGSRKSDQGGVMVMDMAKVVQQFELWRRFMPKVEPFYAVKCNPNPVLLEVLRHLGANFDCATPHEIKLVASMGHDISDIIYAHPCKPVSHIEEARELGVTRTVFDNESELDKMAQYFPNASLLMRIACVDDNAQCPMSLKFGCTMDEVPKLLEKAAALNLNVVGVHFHVGSGCQDVSSYRRALLDARKVFDLGTELGLRMNILDIGGGFPGCSHDGQSASSTISFEEIAAEVNKIVDVLFKGVRVIGEPGRFMVAGSSALVTRIVSKSKRTDFVRYYINDGLYGSLNCVLYDHQIVKPYPLFDEEVNKAYGKVTTTMFGPTCDGFDKVISNYEELPEMDAGDYLIWPDVGAYTTAAATRFNGFDMANYFYFS
jgi:ornithine decarboxylase